MTMTTETFSSMPRGMVPNSRFPLLVHRGGVPAGDPDAVRDRLRGNGWGNNWFYAGIYTYHHFHSTAHEVLGCAVGWTEIEFFGAGGTTLRVEAGDAVVLPAGVGHSMTGNSDDNVMVGGYDGGRDWDSVDVDRLTPEAFRDCVKRIFTLPIPPVDPVTGQPITQWLDAPSSVDAGWNDFRESLEVY